MTVNEGATEETSCLRLRVLFSRLVWQDGRDLGELRRTSVEEEQRFVVTVSLSVSTALQLGTVKLRSQTRRRSATTSEDCWTSESFQREELTESGGSKDVSYLETTR